MRQPRHLPNLAMVMLALAISAQAAEPAIYSREPTFGATAVETRERLSQRWRGTGFRPLIHGLMRKDGPTRKVVVDVSAVDRLYLVAHHPYTKCRIPAVWGNAVLVGKDGKAVSVASLKPASVSAPGGFTRHDGRPVAVGSTRFEHGLFVVAPAEIVYDLGGQYVRFEADIGISQQATHGYSVRFKVLNCPNAQDLTQKLWDRLARDFPRETRIFGRDGDYWMGNEQTHWLESRIINRIAKGMGTQGEGVLKELAECAGADSAGPRQRMGLLAKATRLEGHSAVLRRVDVKGIAELIARADSADRPALRTRLESLEGRLTRLAEAIRRADDTALGDLPRTVRDAQTLLREALIAPLGASEVVFTVRDPGRDGHWYANFGYWCSDPERKIYCPGGSRLAKLDLRTGDVVDLLSDPEGAFRDPQVHYDGKKMVFSYRKGGTEHYQLYEMQVDGTGLRQLTSGPYDDIEPTYLADGDIVFCSSRCNRWVNCFYTQVAVLYRCGPDGQDIRRLSSNVEHDNTPWPLPDGRLLYTRWEYVDRSQMAFHHLWTVNPDGTGQMTYYGNQTPGRVFIDAKPIPGSRKIVASFCPGHGRREHAGAVTVVDPARGPDEPASEKCINGAAEFRDPWPIAEDLFLVAREKELLVMNGDGVTQELYRAEKMLHEPRPVRARTREHVPPPRTDLSATHGRLVLQDVTVGRNMAGVAPGGVKKLLVLESLPKSVNHSGGMDMLSELGTFTLERVLGTVPVEPDGSANFLVPANRPVFFVALDENDLSVKRMQSFVSVLPGETTSCVGCHESRTAAPALGSHRVVRALQRDPSVIEPFTGLPDVIDFPRHIQPILDRHCVGCHNYEKREGGVVLVSDYGARRGERQFTQGYWTLLLRKQFADGGNKYGNRPPRVIGTGASPLVHKIRERHHKVALSADEARLIWMWIEVGAPYAGTYASLLSTTGPTVRSSAWSTINKRCASCHSKPGMRLPTDIRGIKPHYYREIPAGAERFATPLLFNVSRPGKSLALLAPLAKEAGGYGICPGPVFADTKDADYRSIFDALQPASQYLETAVLYHMPGFKPNAHYVREMKRYGVLPAAFDPETEPIDVFATDQAYWRSFWHTPPPGP